VEGPRSLQLKLGSLLEVWGRLNSVERCFEALQGGFKSFIKCSIRFGRDREKTLGMTEGERNVVISKSWQGLRVCTIRSVEGVNKVEDGRRGGNWGSHERVGKDDNVAHGSTADVDGI